MIYLRVRSILCKIYKVFGGLKIYKVFGGLCLEWRGLLL
jgi:hypothetical protein